MLHARRQIIWIEDTTTLMPVQAAHNLAAMHYARDSRLKLQANGGKGPEGADNDAGKEVKELSKWSTAHPMASVSSVLMQSVEPLEDVVTGLTELMPMPNPTAPSAAEVRLVLARRRMLDRERAQHGRSSAGNGVSITAHHEQPPMPSGSGNEASNSSNDNVTLPPNTAAADKPRVKAVEFVDKTGKKLTQGTADTTGLQDAVESAPARDAATATATATATAAAATTVANELSIEASQDSRLVLPVLESLIALRRSRLTRPAPPAQQPPQSPYPPARPSNMSINGGGGGGGGGGTTAGDVATLHVSSVTSPPSASAKTTGGKATRRFGTNTTTACGAANAAASQPPLRLQSDVTTAQADGPSAAAAAAAATLPSSAAVVSNRPPMMQPPTLSQFPGPFRSTRRWEVFLPDGPCGPPVSGVVGGGAVSPGGVSLSPTARIAGSAATAATGSAGRTCGVSWAGNETPLERAAVAVGSFGTGSKSGAAAPLSPVGQIAATAAGRSSDASASVGRTSRMSPRTSIELGLASSTDEGPDDSGGMPRSVTRQQALLQEWHEWRERGSLGPPPGIDEETDCSGDGDGAAAAAAASKDMEEEEGEEEEEDDDGCGLLLGLSNGLRPAGKPAAAGDDDDTDDVEAPGATQATWQRTRRITQCFDVLGLEGLSVPASMAKASMSAPLGMVLSPTSPAGPPPPPPPALSGISSPSAAPSPSVVQGLGAAPLSPMASRRRGDNNGARPGVGPLALPMWLNGAFGAGAATATSSRIPSLANAKHLSFTSKFNRFKERIQSFSLVHPTPAAGDLNVVERAQSMMASGAAGPRTRVTGSNDGRNAVPGFGIGVTDAPSQQQQPMIRQTQGRKGPPGTGAGASTTDLSIRPTGRGSGEPTPPRISNRHSLDSRLPTSKVRNAAVESTMPISPAATVGGGGMGGQQPQQGLHEAFMVTNYAERSRRGDSSVHHPSSLLPPVRLL
ncbi:hypothetical protein Vretimale_7605 [Volvox reticuliferus]|uniref:Uncharacterized protein n=1 Tax=Volvox reticuliferus TaxID=1737510 RepID=A0A8J4G9N4_9CHLO|nr:hypothetical protein Vretimale_7605 [Volvox reticuliferus]